MVPFLRSGLFFRFCKGPATFACLITHDMFVFCFTWGWGRVLFARSFLLSEKCSEERIAVCSFLFFGA